MGTVREWFHRCKEERRKTFADLSPFSRCKEKIRDQPYGRKDKNAESFSGKKSRVWGGLENM